MRECTRAGVQAGFHCIGDAAVGQVLDAVGVVVDELGAAAVRACRHRLEHVEMADDDGRSRGCASWAMVASVQPAFDAAWGGDRRHVRERLGAERAVGCNPFADLADAGVALALGSDAPVTPLDPWGGVHAAVDHRTPRPGCARSTPSTPPPTAAGTPPAPSTAAGPLAVGAPADLALWATDPDPVRRPVRARPARRCRLLLVDGEHRS